jgi:hypothetical protein
MMGKLQNLTWVTAISILGLNSYKILNVNASVASEKLNLTQSSKTIINTTPNIYLNSTKTHSSSPEIAQKPAEPENTSETEDEMIDALQKRQEKLENFSIENKKTIPQPQEKLENFSIENKKTISQPAESSQLPATTAFRMLTIGIPATVLVFLIATPFVKGILGVFKSNVDEKFGKPKVPDGAIALQKRREKESPSPLGMG